MSPSLSPATPSSAGAGPSSQNKHLGHQQQQQQPPPPLKQPPAFEFMKRKRWANLLISELSEAIILVLSASCNVLFCRHAVLDLLGWKDEELIDGDLIELMNGACAPLSHYTLRSALRRAIDCSLTARAGSKQQGQLPRDPRSRLTPFAR